ncbi:MAG TPA: type II toxin-antitoxin system VapC family toxin [Candidatus Solibacter sp.]|nr:type II toxin-antitoxin system VapC family toxin [Candidatus Solibacter sp.]
MRFVLDASVSLSWLIDKPVAPYATSVRQQLRGDNRAVVPQLWQSEVANGLVVAERRGLVNPSDIVQILQQFDTIARLIDIRNESVSIRRTIATARASGLTAYDAIYLDLARDQQLPIATLDRQLAAAAKKAGVPLLA